MSSSEVVYHIDEEGRQVIAERNGRAIGVMPWTLEGRTVTLGLTVVAPHERRKGVGSTLAYVGRERFPREDGWELNTTLAISPLMRKHIDAEAKRTDLPFDYVGPEEASPVSTPEVTRALNLAQQDLDRLLGK